ncbi:hypothetical protein PS15m_006608 [Mucor circinelloides]
MTVLIVNVIKAHHPAYDSGSTYMRHARHSALPQARIRSKSWVQGYMIVLNAEWLKLQFNPAAKSSSELDLIHNSCWATAAKP